MSILQAPVPAGPALRALAASVFLASITVSSGPAAGQVASQSVNMVSGIQWPGGDPFLQRQNEPSVAMSSRNPRHLLAGANDYRTVDIPFATPNAPETGDAWLGVFKSFDGGVTWRSTLLPGYPQQPGGPAGPLAGFTTAADPVVRAGTNGLFYYSGIAFNRDTKAGVVFVARFMDLNNKENGDPTTNSDPIRYVGTTVVDSAAPNAPFIDKPWIAVDKPRLLDGVCHLIVPQPLPSNPNATVSQTVPAGAVYAAWTEVSGTGSALTTNVFFSSSSDCGGTWSRPVKLNDTNKVNQGASIAIDPATGVIYVVWRRLASGSQTDAIMMTRSFRGLLFSTPSVVASLPAYSDKNPTAPSFFDQGTTGDSFRTTAYPVIGIDRRPDAGSEDDDEPDTPAFRGKVFVAWSQRGIGPSGDARVVLSVSTDGGSSWSRPTPVDNSDLTDDTGHVFSRGHQFMPQMTVSADKITIIYYDARFDHTFGLFSPWNGWYNSFFPDPVTGKFYLESRALRGELLDPGGSAKVFTPFFVETGMTEWRHTLDLRFAQADSAASPLFSSSRLSQYSFGTRGDEVGAITALQQLQIDPPNLRLFQQGSVPFIGDYIDVAGPTFQPPAAPGRRWRFNSLPGTSPVFLASWTSNQDVRPPVDGDWTHYTPAGSTTSGAQSVFNSGSQRPPCVIGQEGMRNQNIYAARISQGLAVTSAQNAKPLSSSLQRDLALSVENLTLLERTFRLTIAGQPTGGRASFVPAPNPPPSPLPPATTTLDVVIPAKSAVARSVYALSTDPHARIEVDVAEVNGAPGGALKTNGLTGFVIFNTDSSAPNLIDPDNNSAGSVTTVEIYNPNVSNPNVSNPNVSNPNVSNPNVSNPNVSNPNVSNPNVSNPNVSNPDLANPNVSNPNVSNPNVSNPNVSNPNVSNPNVSNPNVSNAPVSDATYTVTNTGNTASTYRIQLVGTAPTGTPLQLIITKPYTNPASLNCVLFEQQHNIPVANVINPGFLSPNSPPAPGITDPSEGNATFVLGPGELILVTIRAPVDVPTLTNIIQNVAPVVVAHAPNTNDATNQPATSPPAITTLALPDGVSGQAYSASITALGGRPPYTWTATGLPANLSISGTTTGVISGTPSAAGTFSAGVSVKDSASKTGSHTYTLRIWSPLSITTASLPNGTVGTAYSQPLAAGGGTGTYTWSLASGSLPPGLVLSTAGVLAGTPTASGTYPFTVKVTDSASPAQGVTQALRITTIPAGPPTLVLTSAPASVVGGQPFTLRFRVQDSLGGAIPGAAVSLSFDAKGCPAAALSGGLSVVSDQTGNAQFPSVVIDRGGPGFTIRAASGTATATTGAIYVEGFCATGGLSPSRIYASLTELADGRVLLAGGQDGGGNTLATALIYDPLSGLFTSTGNLNVPRYHQKGVLLPSGKVLIAGGAINPSSGTRVAELFDPSTGLFTPTTGLLGLPRTLCEATWVPSIQRVLITGGYFSTAEVYDPSTDSFTPTASMATNRYNYHSASLLPDGRVLVAGGIGSAGVADGTAEIWNPSTGTFSSTGALVHPRYGHGAATLADGRILLVGGYDLVPTETSTAELYDPAIGQFSSTASMASPRALPLVASLASGKVLVASGWGGESSAEVFDPLYGSFSATGSPTTQHLWGNAVLLSSGRVLVAGGYPPAPVAELYHPSGGYTLSGRILWNNSDPITTKTSVPPRFEITDLSTMQQIPVLTTFDPATSEYTISNILPARIGVVVRFFTTLPGGSPGEYEVLLSSLDLSGLSAASRSNYTLNANLLMTLTQPSVVATTCNLSTPPTLVSPVSLAWVPVPDATRYIVQVNKWVPAGPPSSVFASDTASTSVTIPLATTGTGEWYDVGLLAYSAAGPLLGYFRCSATSGFGDLHVLIADPLLVTTTSLPAGTVGAAYAQTLAATGGTGARTWSLAGGALPPGVSLSPAGVLSGIPTAANSYLFTVRVSDSGSPAQSAAQAVTLVVSTPSLVITSAPTSVVGGQPFGISVNLKDGSGSPMAGAPISLSFATRGCLGGLGAALSGTVSALTGTTGDAVFPGVLIDRGGAGFTLRATFGVATAVTGPIFVEGFCTTGNLTPSRYDTTLTNLADGRVLLTGGIQPGSTYFFDTATVYDAFTGQFTPAAGTMTTTRAEHRAVLLPNGKVLIVGGSSGPSAPPLLTAELFDPASQTFTLSAGLTGTSRSSFRAIWVPGISKVLILGGNNGVDLASAELYDPATDAFSPTNPMTTPRSGHTADLLPDGRILVVGGFSGSATLATAEIWDPTTGTFTPTGSLHSPRASHASVILPDGRVLVAGGVSVRGGSNALATAEIYDPVTATFAPTAALTTARSEPLLSALPSGKVLVASGFDAANATLTSAELFDPASGVFTSTGSSWAAHTEGEAVLLSTGNVLAAGGWTGFGAAELYFPQPQTTFVWARQFGTASDDWILAISAAPSGVYIAGVTAGTLPGQTSSGYRDAFVRKVDPAGNEFWTRQFGAAGEDEINGIASDASGVYVAGYTSGTLPGQTSGGAEDAFVRKYDSAGNVLWTRQFGGAGTDVAYGVAVDASSLYVVGYTEVTPHNPTSDFGYDVIVRRYDLEGSLQWSRQFGSADVIVSEFGYCISADSSGVYVGGVTYGTLPGQTSSGNHDAFVRKYDLAGNELWTRQFGTAGWDTAWGIASDASGVYVGGFTNGTLAGQTSSGGYDAFVKKFDRDGNELWTRQFGTVSSDSVRGISLDVSGIYVTGYVSGALPGQIPSGDGDIFVRKYDAAGSEVWTRQFGTVVTDVAYGISVGASGVYVGGTTQGGFPDQSNAGGLDALIVALAK